MPKFNIKIANTVFEINSIHDFSDRFFIDYLSNQKPDYIINVKNEDIEYGRRTSNKFIQNYGIEKDTINDEKIERYSILKLISDYFIDKHVLLFHGAVIEKDNNAYMFIAPSKVGKTTHVLNWIKQYPDACIINGDMPFLIIDKDKVYAAGSPWSGKEGLNTNKIVPLKAICLINRSENNSIFKLEDIDLIFEKLYGHVFKRTDQVLNIVKDIKTIIENVCFYSLECNMDIDAAKVAYEKMK